jgi:hypothetical protein
MGKPLRCISGVVVAAPPAGVRIRTRIRLSDQLGAAREALAAGRPSIAVGGKRLWRNRTHLDEAGMSEAQWRTRWDAARMFLTADGEA